METEKKPTTQTESASPAEPEQLNLYDLFIGLLTVLSLTIGVLMLLLPKDVVVQEVLFMVDNLFCVIFMADFFGRLIRAPSRRDYFWQGVTDFLGSIPAIPALRLFRLFRLARVIRILRIGGPKRILREFAERRSESALYITITLALVLLTVGSMGVYAFESAAQDKKNRSHLPMPNTSRPGLITYDAKDPDTKFPPIEQLRPPKGAPNVLIILIDDAGFGSASAFGGPCQTPNAEKLAANGLRFNRFHTTALCSPTRQALLTGRNHHSAGMGGITEIATGAPGYCSVLPNSMSPLAKTLKLNGYSTAQFGKCHEVPVWEASPVGPFDAWPTGGGGFEYFYGFLGGEANQWYPTLYEGTTPVEPEKTPEEGYHLMEDMTDKAMAWMSQQKALAPDKPFFVYFAPGATHAPHHVPKEWADKYKGKFDAGWDALREETIARQKKLGVIPADCDLTARHKEISAWSDAPEAFKQVLRRQMEVYAGFMEYTDHHVGRLIDGLQKLGVLDDTLVYYIIGDNGASAEGGINGCFNEMGYFNGLQAFETPEYLGARLDKLGGPESYNHYAVGWAHAMNTPYQWTKQVASHFGGTRNGTIVHWPNGIKAKGEIRSQFTHVIDVAPTILEAAGIPEPVEVNGVHQDPTRGREHALRVRRRQRGGAARDAVLRDVRQPRHLPQGVDCGDETPDAVGGLYETAGLRR